MAHTGEKRVITGSFGLQCTDTLKITVFDFVTQLFSLLSDPRLNKLSNLVVNAESPFDKFEPHDGLLGEMLSGAWYRCAFAHMIARGFKDF